MAEIISIRQRLSRLRDSDLFYALLVLVIGALAYLLFIRRLGFYGDDWYLIFDGHSQGAAFFKTVFSSDRPARALVMSAAYSLFGDHLVLYHLSAFLFRYFASLAFYWTLTMVWKQEKHVNFMAALLFFIYPGFLSQLQPVDYQSQILSLCLAMISIALSIWTVSINASRLLKIVLYLVSLVAGFFYLALVEYFIGLEFMRLLFIGCVTLRQAGAVNGWRIAWLSFLRWLPYALIPVGFLVWRLFFFESTRAATNAGTQLGGFFAAPLLTGLHWLVNSLMGMLNVVFSAWLVPFYNIVVMGAFRLRESLLIMLVAAGGLIIFLASYLATGAFSREFKTTPNVDKAIFWGSLAAILAGVLPVIITNRTVDFASSRYTLAAAPGAIILFIAFITNFLPFQKRVAAVAVLVFLSVATHMGVAINLANQADSLRDFWWQVSWRAPSIEAGTNLVASYSRMESPEEYVIWGPANLIYFPEKQDAIPVRIKLPAALPNEETVANVLGRSSGRDLDRRGNYVHQDLTALLVMTQPSMESCVRIIDGSMPELSPDDPHEIMLLAPYSLIGNVNMSDRQLMLPPAIFGREPQHGWCWYYQKASLARQNEDWQTIITLGESAASNGLSPHERIEWMPFMQAYAATGDKAAMESFAPVMKEIPFIREQACSILGKTAVQYRPDDLELKNLIEQSFCLNGETE